MDNAFRYIKANGGIDTEESYPYEARDGPCRFRRANVGATVTGKIYYDMRGFNKYQLVQIPAFFMAHFGRFEEPLVPIVVWEF